MLMVITNRHLIRDGDLLHKVEAACKGGASHIMLREKDLDEISLLDLALKTKQITDQYGVKLIINNNIPVANKVKAYGVQLSISNLKHMDTCETAVGISVHSYDEAIQSIRCGADYLIASHMYVTDCKPGLPPKGIGLIREIRLSSSIDIIGLGGITIDNCHGPIAAGAQGVAVMSGPMINKDTEQFIKDFNLRL